MGIKYSKDVVKLGFVDNSINWQSNFAQGGYPFGYFYDTNKTRDERMDLLQAKAEEKLCNRIPPAYIDDIRVPSKNGTIIYENGLSDTTSVEDLPNVKDLTQPPSLKNNMLFNAAILGVGVYVFFKLVE